MTTKFLTLSALALTLLGASSAHAANIGHIECTTPATNIMLLETVWTFNLNFDASGAGTLTAQKGDKTFPSESVSCSQEGNEINCRSKHLKLNIPDVSATQNTFTGTVFELNEDFTLGNFKYRTGFFGSLGIAHNIDDMHCLINDITGASIIK